MSHPVFFWCGCYVAVSVVVGLGSWCDVTRTVHGRTIRVSSGLGRVSFIRALIWPVFIVMATIFLLHQNYKRWQAGLDAQAPGPAPDPPPPAMANTRPPIDYGFSCIAGPLDKDGFVEVGRYGDELVFRVGNRSGIRVVHTLSFLQAKTIASGLLTGIPEKVVTPVVEHRRRTVWERLLNDKTEE